LRKLVSYIVFALLLISPAQIAAQEKKCLNFNIYNGLPSNRVYFVTTDHLGYLWIATDKGVLRYDGYELKLIDLSGAGATNDIWNIHEDKKNRLWLFGISNTIGYLKNNKFHKVYSDRQGAFYPLHPRDYRDGMCFVSSIIENDRSSATLKDYFCVEKNDSIKTYSLYKFGLHMYPVTDSSLVALLPTDLVSNLTLRRGVFHAIEKGSIFKPSAGFEKRYIYQQLDDYNCVYFDDRIIYYHPHADSIGIVNLRDVKIESVNAKKALDFEDNEHIVYIHDHHDKLVVFTNQYVRVLNSSFMQIGKYPVASLCAGRDDELSYFMHDKFWGRILATNTNGIYHSFNTGERFHSVSGSSFKNYRFCGSVSDSVGYWFNRVTHKIARFGKGLNIEYRNLDDIKPFRSIPYNVDSFLLLSTQGAFLIDNNTLTGHKVLEVSVMDGIVSGIGELYYLSKFRGFYKFTVTKKDIYEDIDGGRYKGIVYDSVRKRYVVYNDHKILLYKPGQSPYIYISDSLTSKGIGNIEKIHIEQKGGSIIIQEEKRIIHLADFDKPFEVVSGGYILDNAKTLLRGNLLVTAGKFGVSFARVNGANSISRSIVYPNVYKMYYDEVYDLQLLGENLLVQTDKGMFSVAIPNDSDFDKDITEHNQNYKTILTYSDSSFSVQANDTINLKQSDARLQFDIIKPTGSGSLKYTYCLSEVDSTWNELSNNELTLQNMEAGKYYSLSVIANDDQWRSAPLLLHVYFIPHWWQRSAWKSVIWSASIGIVMALIYLIVLITRRNVTAKAAKKQLQLELELKSVYSQLNPHFIFNSLNGALYLVKTKRLDDAYEHIYKFSHLMRAYIKSSRNRYIKLREEIENLKSYIELQQVRFRDRFDFEIFVDESLDTSLEIPTLLMQPLVENAINHGLVHKEDRGLLRIRFIDKLVSQELICVIEDDGIGRAESQLRHDDNPLKEESYGTDLINDLSNVFNKYEKMKIQIAYIDKAAPHTGTIVTVTIKFNL
jgi:hypothetical protein